YETAHRPDVGLAVARMAAHVTYVSEQSLQAKFGRARSGDTPRFGADFEVEHYLDHQGEAFLQRFDANTYLYLSRAMDYFQPLARPDALARLAEGHTRYLLISFDTDWRFPTAHTLAIAVQLDAAGASVQASEIASPFGHDSFLLEVPAYHEAVRTFLAS
ncbi:MAG: homoserine O-acetyltransferase, partial [Actinobacteria bacterium]|nr:homoserine O-acetyltransferase [Actinomycetota bacterium]